MVGEAGTCQDQLPHPHGRHSAKSYSSRRNALTDEHDLRERSGCAERGTFRHDAPAMANRKPNTQGQSARLCHHQSAHLHLQHGEHQRRNDQ